MNVSVRYYYDIFYKRQKNDPKSWWNIEARRYFNHVTEAEWISEVEMIRWSTKVNDWIPKRDEDHQNMSDKEHLLQIAWLANNFKDGHAIEIFHRQNVGMDVMNGAHRLMACLVIGITQIDANYRTG